jgi:SAM-dependent methyltransferase
MIAPPFEDVRCLICESPTEFRYPVRDHLHGTPGDFALRACRNCGCGITVPVVSEDTLPQYYASDYYTHELVRGPRAVLRAIDLARRVNRHGLDRLARGTVLEIGPGDCSFLDCMDKRGWRVTGLDPDEVVLKNGTRRGYRMIAGTVPALPNERYDLIVAWHSLEHSADPKRDVAILAGQLSDRGKLLIGVPNYGSRMARAFGPCWFDLEVPRHRVHFTLKGLELLLASAGLRIERIRHWLSPYALAASLNYRRGGGKIRPVTTALSMAFWPLCWPLEAFGAGDSVSIVAERRTA